MRRGFVKIVALSGELAGALQPWQLAIRDLAQSTKKLVPLFMVKPR